MKTLFHGMYDLAVMDPKIMKLNPKTVLKLAKLIRFYVVACE
jgi:hypothetical protein